MSPGRLCPVCQSAISLIVFRKQQRGKKTETNLSFPSYKDTTLKAPIEKYIQKYSLGYLEKNNGITYSGQINI